MIDDKFLWSCLAAAASEVNDSETKKVCYEKMNKIDKVGNHTDDSNFGSNQISSNNSFDKNIQSLINSGNILKAVYLYISNNKWEKALALSINQKDSQDVVFALRQEWLENLGLEKEISEVFEKAGRNVRFDLADVKQRLVNL